MGLRVLKRVGPFCVGCAVMLLVGVAPATPRELVVTTGCAFTPEQQEELDARVRLLVHGAPPPAPESVAISCNGDAGSVTLRFADHARSRPISTAGEPIERVLVTIEQLLAEHPAPTVLEPSVPESALPPKREATLDSPAANVDPEPNLEAPAENRVNPNRTIGGAGLGLSVERWPEPAGVAVGPRLDFAWGVGSWAATSFESVRFGSTPEARLLAFDALVGVAWGGPFAAQRAGAVFAFGGEWFSRGAAAEPTGQRTSSSFVIDVGLRWSETVGAGALWLGADGRFRVRPPELPEPGPASLSRWSVIASLGGALTVR